MLRTSLRRLGLAVLGAVVAVPLATATPAAADEVTVLPGCWGAATAIYCDVKVEYTLPYDVDTYTTTVPVCAGTCTDVPVTLVSATPQESPQVCLSYENRAGAVVYRHCQPLTPPTIDPDPWVDFARELLSRYRVSRCGDGFRVYDTQGGYDVIDACFVIS